MTAIKLTSLSIWIVCLITLGGCNQQAPEAEQIPYVMVTQPQRA